MAGNTKPHYQKEKDIVKHQKKRIVYLCTIKLYQI